VCSSDLDKIGNSSYQFIELEEALYNVLA